MSASSITSSRSNCSHCRSRRCSNAAHTRGMHVPGRSWHELRHWPGQ